ncbi:carotenoid oxygenase family protein [Thermopolyspora sp. NPDC052614]|uniref:carotenoid oxygenase family protein n=1 Tax=Thermopolyspora sp. NPDC052614 TaxID=3155682 RepID=UPI003439BCC3
MSPTTEHENFRGVFTPVTEEVTAFDLPVTGRIPAELNGRYLRNGPNPMSLDDPKLHVFLGDGMVHGVRLRDGRAEWYRNRWVRSARVAERLGEPWPGGPVHDGMDFPANTHVIEHAGRTLALVEAGPRPYELTYELDTIGPCDFGGTLPGGYVAHSKLDPRTGELHAIAYYWGWDHLQYVRIDKAGLVTRTVNIPVEGSPMVHDCALTERYVVVYDLPITFDMELAARGVGLPYSWNERHRARVGLLPREGGAADVRWFDLDPCWVFHTLNAYDDGDRVVVDAVVYPRVFGGGRLEGGLPTLDRWTIDVPAGKVTTSRLDDRAQEFPRVDERYVSLPYRYGYAVCVGDLNERFAVGGPDLNDLDDDAFGNALIKHDLRIGSKQTRNLRRDAYAGEPVFVPAEGAAAEDDGYVLAYVNNPDRGAADLMILSAQDFTGEPVAVVHLPARIPLGFHGSWAPDTR